MVEAEAEAKEGEQQPQPEEAEEKEATPTSTGEEQRKEEAPKEYVCGVCGKAFEKPESLRSHRLRSHRISTHVEVGREGVTSVEHAPPSRLDEAPPSTTYPTDRDHLHNLLSKLRFTRVDAVVEACDVRGYSVTAAYDILREMNASEAITRSAVSYWSRVKGEAIPYYIKARLGIRDVYDDYQSRVSGYESGYDYRYGYGYPARQNEGDLLTGVGNIIRAVKEEGGLSQRGGGDNELITQLQSQVSSLQRELHDGDNKLITQLQSQLSNLQKELRDLKEDETRTQVQALKEEISELKKLLEKNSGDVQLNFLDKRFKQVGEKTDRLINVLEPISRAYGRRVYETYTGDPLPESPAREKPAGKRSIVDMLPGELIEEEADRQAREAEKEARETNTGGEQT